MSSDWTPSTDWTAWAQALIPAMDAAGAAILEVARNGFEVHRKADASPVTEADLAANRVLLAAIRELTPAPILSEEGCGMPAASGQPSLYWAVDPLDGTKEFLRQNGEYTVNVALIESGIPVLGLVLQPINGDLWLGINGRSARVRRDGVWHAISSAPLAGRPRVSVPRPPIAPPMAPRIALSRSHASNALGNCLAHLGEYEPVTLGSSLKLTWLAEGKLDLYPRLNSGMSQWDLAAGHAVLLAAGGAVVTLQGAPLRYCYSEHRVPAFLAIADRNAGWPERFRAARSQADAL